MGHHRSYLLAAFLFALTASGVMGVPDEDDKAVRDAAINFCHALQQGDEKAALSLACEPSEVESQALRSACQFASHYEALCVAVEEKLGEDAARAMRPNSEKRPAALRQAQVKIADDSASLTNEDGKVMQRLRKVKGAWLVVPSSEPGMTEPAEFSTEMSRMATAAECVRTEVQEGKYSSAAEVWKALARAKQSTRLEGSPTSSPSGR